MTANGDDRGDATELRRAVLGDAQIVGGTAIGHYRIEAVLGGGGMGVVYRAIDLRLNRPVAIKFLSAHGLDGSARDRFQREAQTASALNHPHILTVHDVGDFAGRQYLVTELVDGGTLEQWGEGLHGRRDWRRIIELLVGVADGLAAAHAAGILHRDVKPANVLVSKSGHAKLADFGLAKSIDEATQRTSHTAAGFAIGTVGYMSPEQAAGGRVDARSDVFAFGVLLYELLEGRAPFPGRNNLEILQSILHTAPQPLSDDMPESLRALVEKALEKDPAERYQTMRDLVVDLRRVLRRSSDSQSSAGLAPATAPRSRRVWAVGGALVVAALLVMGAAVWLHGPTTTAEPGAIRQPAAASTVTAANPRIAILPFENMSPDPGNAFFTDGLHEEILTTLAGGASDLEVVSRTTMMLYRAAPKPVTEIAAELGATYVLSGSVRREGDAVRLSLQLVEALTDRVVLSENYNRTLSNALTLQSEVAELVARQLSARVSGVRQGATALTTDPAAYDLYLKARLARRALNGSLPAQAWLEAQRLLDEAITRDPKFTRAYVARSELHGSMVTAGYDTSVTRRNLALRDAETARQLAPDDPVTLAAQALLEPTASRAIELFDAAESAGLSDPDLLFAKAGILARVGRSREGVELMSRLMALDPGNQQLAAILWVNLLQLREPKRALETLATIAAHSSSRLPWDPLYDTTLYMFKGNTDVLAPWSGAEFFRQMTQAGLQEPGDALRNNVERLVVRERYAEARDLIDSVSFETTRNVFVGAFLATGSGDTPNADYRGWISLLLGDSAAAVEDGRRVLDFLASAPETPTNGWYRLSLRADAAAFGGDREAAARDARAMLARAETEPEQPDVHAAARLLAARTFAWIGEEDAAVDLLERLAVDEPGMSPGEIARQPWYTVPLRDHARFRALLARLEAQMAATALE